MNSCFLFYSALSLQFDCRKLVVNVISSIGHDIFHKSNILPYSSFGPLILFQFTLVYTCYGSFLSSVSCDWLNTTYLVCDSIFLVKQIRLGRMAYQYLISVVDI